MAKSDQCADGMALGAELAELAPPELDRLAAAVEKEQARRAAELPHFDPARDVDLLDVLAKTRASS